ncbi:hypothetical protein [Deinococcus sp. Leaf326]|uniref:hypothetical protein n=1 Tax=Deinococcus sp. Leaf326 TaxID=1736338 RepID=UPI000700EE97|nr:hypothetical protein [Deinococcus sp. Leaf326]KQR02416.1 hypothetical protein ASF71_21465 [Deinococcus sp. Leaf326]
MKGKRLEGFSWYRAFRLNNVPNEPNSPGEGTSVVFQITGQSDFGNTANTQTSRIFASFGVRGGDIVPVLEVHGNRRLSNRGESMGFRVYKNADGYYWLYIRTAVYSAGTIQWYIPNEDAGNTPFQITDTISHNGAEWVIPKPTGSGELIWDYDTAEAFQPLVVGKGYALTSTDLTGLMIAGPIGDFPVTGGLPARFPINRAVMDNTGRGQPDHSYKPAESARGNTELGPGLYHYTLELVVKGGQAGAVLTTTPQRLGVGALLAHKRVLRGGDETVTMTGTIPLHAWQNLWFDLSCDQNYTVGVDSLLTVHRGYGQ